MLNVCVYTMFWSINIIVIYELRVFFQGITCSSVYG